MHLCPFIYWNLIYLLIFFVQAATKISLKWTDITDSSRQIFISCLSKADIRVDTILTVVSYFCACKSKLHLCLQQFLLTCESAKPSPYSSPCVAEPYIHRFSSPWCTCMHMYICTHTHMYLHTHCLDHWQHSGAATQKNYFRLLQIFSWIDDGRICIW